METTIALFLLSGVAVLFVLEVVLGRPGSQGAGRLPAVEFATRLLPLFLGGLGLALAASHRFLGAGLVVLAFILFLAGTQCRTQAKS